MTEAKLIKYLQIPRKPLTGTQHLTPIINSDSKGTYLRDQVIHPIDKNIHWRCKPGTTIQDQLKWLKTNIKHKIQRVGDISVYIWSGTCNLTTRDKNGYISITSTDDDTIQLILDKLHECIETQLQQQIIKINDGIKYLNSTLGIKSPCFSVHLQSRRQR
ncbi:unnamed protein product [Mytilus coruscus]|uniref:Uncharacterized protein n=1 Tax=Mytilus coruscus TaxID=42192 RepID=A0A6J8B3G9_MYTCO|nr:unnamed protein product [Mytilus coruscus]